MQVAFSVNRIYSTPPVLPENASPDVFSEARALSTVKDLTETIGYRLVSLFLLHLILRCSPQQGGTGPVSCLCLKLISYGLPTRLWQMQALTSDLLLDRATKCSSETHT